MKKSFLAAASALALMSAAQAHAQAPAGDVEGVTVTATGRSSATSTTKTNSPIIESIQAISIISAEEINLRASPTIADALSYTAGVQSESFGADSRVDEVAVRGFGAGGFSSNNNFVDGLRLPSGGQWTRPGFDPFALQQIEVLKGPSGALYGQTAPGGLVNIVTKRPTDTWRGEIMVQSAGFTDLERWNRQAAGDLSGPLSDQISGRIVALARDGDSQVQGVGLSRYYVSPSLTWKNETTKLTGLAQFQRDKGGATFQFLPQLGSLVPSAGRTIATEANIGEPDWNVFNRDQRLVAAFLEHKVSDSLTLRNNSRLTHIDTLYRVVVLGGDTVRDCTATIPGCVAGQTVVRRAVQGKGKSDGFATDTQLEWRGTTGAAEHTILVGLDHFRTDWKHYRDGVAPALVLPILNIFNPVSRGAQGYANGLSPQIHTETVTKQTGLYIQDQIAIGRLRVTVGGRQDWTRDNTYDPVKRARYINKNDAFTWRAGGVYLFDNGFAPYASYAKSFLPQVSDPTTSLNGVRFVPTTGDQIEAGLRYQRGRSLYLTLGAYQITQQNMTTPAPGAVMCGLSICFVQTGEGRVRGLEFEGKTTFSTGTTLIATATRTEGEITKSNTASQIGNRLPQVPKQMASLFVNQTLPGVLGGVSLGGGLRYTGKSFGEITNQLPVPDYTLVDLFLRYDFGVAAPRLEGLTASINARNVGDKQFVATCTAISACYYGQGRSVTARLQYRW